MALRYFSFNSSILFRASRNSGSSSGIVSSCASRKSVSRPKCRCSSRLARNRTSSASTRSSMFCALVSIVGITARARDSGGIPPEKSIRGSKCGVASKVASQFTSATARWLAHRSKGNPIRASRQSWYPLACALANKPPLKIAVSSVIMPR